MLADLNQKCSFLDPSDYWKAKTIIYNTYVSCFLLKKIQSYRLDWITFFERYSYWICFSFVVFSFILYDNFSAFWSVNSLETKCI